TGELKNREVKLFSADVIYQLTEEYQEWLDAAEKRRKEEWLDAIIRPAKIRIIPKLIFRQSKPAIAGVEILSGTIKKGYGLISQDGVRVGSVESMQDKGDNLIAASKGVKVAMAIKDGVFGRNLDEGDELYVDIPENHYQILEREFKGKLTEDELQLLDEIVQLKRKADPNWGM
ncbi:MAG TPA: translation initiation factor IF-2, partial [Methanobacteriaceae archaeon]|nr:translation initiation factor IF-2 [Methanobacteriaceae archaeon]